MDRFAGFPQFENWVSVVVWLLLRVVVVVKTSSAVVGAERGCSCAKKWSCGCYASPKPCAKDFISKTKTYSEFEPRLFWLPIFLYWSECSCQFACISTNSQVLKLITIILIIIKFQHNESLEILIEEWMVWRSMASNISWLDVISLVPAWWAANGLY